MTTAIRSSTFGGQFTTGISPPLPAGWAVGDLLVLSVYQRGDYATPATASDVATPAGYTRVAFAFNPASGSPDSSYGVRTYVFTKTAVTGETAPTVTTGNGTLNQRFAYAFHALTGVGTVRFDLAAQAISQGTTGTLPAPSLSPTAGNALLLCIFGANQGNSDLSPFTAPSGMTFNGQGNSLGGSIASCSLALTTSGATGAKTAAVGVGTIGAADISLTFVDNSAPYAPTLNSPVGNASVDKAVSQRFSWTFSDPDPGDAQSKFDLQYRIVSTTPWTTVTGITTNQFVDIAGGTFAAGSYEWQVRTYDSQGVVGPFSASGFFTAATAPSGPTITAPTSGATVSTSSGSITWSYPTQSAYRVRKVADNAGVPDTATIYYDSGEITDSTSRSAALTFPVNGRYEHLQVLIRDSGSALLSPYSSVRVQVSYTPPAGPTLVATPNNAAGTISVNVTNPTPGGGQPTVTSWDIYRRVAGDGTAGVRIAASIATTFTDRTPASGVAYEYQVVANGANGTTASSAWTA